MGNVRYSKEKLIFNDLITWTDNSFLVYSSYSSSLLGIIFLHNQLVLNPHFHPEMIFYLFICHPL